MTHLRIELDTSVTEEVSSSVISKLYNFVINNTLDSTSNLLGRLHSATGYLTEVDYLTANYPNLYITCNTYL